MQQNSAVKQNHPDPRHSVHCASFLISPESFRQSYYHVIWQRFSCFRLYDLNWALQTPELDEQILIERNAYHYLQRQMFGYDWLRNCFVGLHYCQCLCLEGVVMVEVYSVVLKEEVEEGQDSSFLRSELLDGRNEQNRVEEVISVVWLHCLDYQLSKMDCFADYHQALDLESDGDANDDGGDDFVYVVVAKMSVD